MGFDLYNMARTSPLRTFCIPTTRRYVKKGVFAEHASVVACGSDHGSVYIFHSNSDEVVQKLCHDGEFLGCLGSQHPNLSSGRALIQTVEVCK